MRQTFYCSILFSLLATAAQQPALAAEQATTGPAGLARKDAILVTLTASVEAIDYTSREVTLKGPLGNMVSFTVDPRVQRLKEIKTGDLVQADYYVSIAAELRKPTAEEEKHPLVVLADSGKAPNSQSPAAGALRSFRVVTTVEGLDRSMQTVTVKGPRGRTLTARVEHPDRLEKMRLGDTIVLTYTEALAISLEKVNRKAGK